MNGILHKLLPVLAFMLIVFAPPVALAEGPKYYKGSFTEIFYTDDSDLVKLNRRVSLRWLKEVSKARDLRDLSLPGAVTRKFDVIRINVELILDMHPRGRLIAFNVLSDDRRLKEVLQKKYGSNETYKAFYSRSDKYIYVAANEVNTNIVAHELAHAVVDLELGPSVPESVHEILARYVDTHLYD